MPHLDLLGYYSIFFACGWLLFAAPGLREAIERRPKRYLRTRGPLTRPRHLPSTCCRASRRSGRTAAFHLLALLLLSQLATWSLVFGLLGHLARHFGHAPTPHACATGPTLPTGSTSAISR